MTKSKRTNLHAQENFYRPILEYRSASVLLICAVIMLVMGFRSDGVNIAPIILYTAVFLLLVCLYRCKTAHPYLMAHWRVFQRQIMFISLKSLRTINKSNFFSNERKYRQLVQEYKKITDQYRIEKPTFVTALNGVPSMQTAHIKLLISQVTKER